MTILDFHHPFMVKSQTLIAEISDLQVPVCDYVGRSKDIKDFKNI